MSDRRVLAVLSGGGAPGLCRHAGMLAALDYHGVEITHWSGTSAGAIAAALSATGRTAGDLKRILYGLTDADIRSPRVAWKLRLPFLRSIMTTDRIRATLDRLLPREAPQDLYIWATAMNSWRPYNLACSEIPLVDAVLASMAVPLVFPAVEFRDVEYQDGGLCFNVPLLATWREYDEVWILIASSHPRSYRGGVPMITQAVRAIDVLMYDQIGDVLEQVAGNPKVRVLWPRTTTGVGLTHLDHSLIAETETEALRMLDREEDGR